MNFVYILQPELTFPQVVKDNELEVHKKTESGMEDFSERLKHALFQAGIRERGSGAFLARLTGLTPKATGKWLNGENRPRKENLEAIADRCQVRVEWLEYGVGPMKPGGNVEMAANYRGTRMAPVLTDVQAGEWGEVCDPAQLGEPEGWEAVPGNVSENAFWLWVKGDSMTAQIGPSVPANSMILVDPEVPADNGRLVVAKLTDSEEVTFKKLVIDGGQKFLKPLNPSYPVLPINGNCRIVGVVVESRQKL